MRKQVSKIQTTVPHTTSDLPATKIPLDETDHNGSSHSQPSQWGSAYPHSVKQQILATESHCTQSYSWEVHDLPNMEYTTILITLYAFVSR